MTTVWTSADMSLSAVGRGGAVSAGATAHAQACTELIIDGGFETDGAWRAWAPAR